ncbi:uncharacterized protein STEHIDRAFT_171620 [Stereum hirsutum FP-91666 SS1]|uniref:uncharacterized protein n=1 Tax=Stereum hirsutum (strain FP-91666) TaxID=721885 RepID=UPI00044494E0|nr:uncharacterized protein STEHIDRAFT_171620 [Stereum hirsutum FP-91666 SS1]EIM82021.1 hypothetical protein STEHIDRAFT_171620 [Stereum hirsutum FP-91666 SS1]
MSAESSPEQPPLFFPEINPPLLKYTDSDRAQAFRSQPLEGIPEYLVPEPSEKRTFLPPLMHYGWILDKDRALRFVQSHGFDPIVSDERGITPNYYAACIEALTILLDEKTGVIPDDPRIKIVFLCDGQYFLNPVKQGKINFHLALSVGTNYEGAIPTKDIEKLGEVIAPGVEPMWFLDMEKWTWSRRAVKSSKPSSKKRKLPRSRSDTAPNTTDNAAAGKTKPKTKKRKPRLAPTSNDVAVQACS